MPILLPGFYPSVQRRKRRFISVQSQLMPEPYKTDVYKRQDPNYPRALKGVRVMARLRLEKDGEIIFPSSVRTEKPSPRLSIFRAGHEVLTVMLDVYKRQVNAHRQRCGGSNNVFHNVK